MARLRNSLYPDMYTDPSVPDPAQDLYSTPGQVTGGPVDKAPQVYPSEPTPQFAQVPGYDFGKLSDPTHRGEGKYNNDVGLYSQGLQALNYGPGSGFTPSEATLTELTNWMNAHGGNVSRQGDVMTFGGPGGTQVDVASDYNPAGGSGGFVFQDPRGQAPAAPGGVGGGAGTQTPQGFGGPIPSLDLKGILSGGGAGSSSTPNWVDEALKGFYQSNLEGMKNPVSAAQFEAIRQPIDKARRTSVNNVAGELANRGTLLGGGDYTNALGRVEERLAPDFASAVQNASVQNAQNARQGALGALQTGTSMAGIKGDLALRELDQNRQWQQFLADFGLRRDQVAELLSQGRIDQVLKYFELWNQNNQTLAGGQIA